MMNFLNNFRIDEVLEKRNLVHIRIYLDQCGLLTLAFFIRHAVFLENANFHFFPNFCTISKKFVHISLLENISEEKKFPIQDNLQNPSFSFNFGPP